MHQNPVDEHANVIGSSSGVEPAFSEGAGPGGPADDPDVRLKHSARARSEHRDPADTTTR